MRSFQVAGVLATLLGIAQISAAQAEDTCPGRPDAIGTARTVSVDPKVTPLLGSLQYKQTIPLRKGEVILTFDDGPLPPMTTRILDTLRDNCVKATFFIVGRMAKAYPSVLRRIAAEGHTIGTHSQNHPLSFPKLSHEEGLKEIEQGFSSTNSVLVPAGAHTAPFFRFPGLGRTKFYETYTEQRSIAVFSVDVVADDWMHLKADEVLNRALDRLQARGSGILLLHDIQPSTATMLPKLLAELKQRGFRIVHVVYDGPAPVAEAAPLAPAGQPAATVPSSGETGAARPVTAWPLTLSAPRPVQGSAPPVPEAPAATAVPAASRALAGSRAVTAPMPQARPVDAPAETAAVHAGTEAGTGELPLFLNLPKLLGDLFPKPAP